MLVDEITRRRIQETFFYFLRNRHIRFLLFSTVTARFRKVSSDNVYDGELTKLWRRQFVNFFV